MGDQYKSTIYEFEQEASEIADEYGFILRLPVALRAPDYQEYFQQRVGEESMESLADLWLEAEENINLRIDIIEEESVSSHILNESSLDTIQSFHDTANRYIELEEKFVDAFGSELPDYTTLSDIMEDRGVDFPEETLETLQDIEEARDTYLDKHGYDFLRGY